MGRADALISHLFKNFDILRLHHQTLKSTHAWADDWFRVRFEPGGDMLRQLYEVRKAEAWQSTHDVLSQIDRRDISGCRHRMPGRLCLWEKPFIDAHGAQWRDALHGLTSREWKRTFLAFVQKLCLQWNLPALEISRSIDHAVDSAHNYVVSVEPWPTIVARSISFQIGGYAGPACAQEIDDGWESWGKRFVSVVD